MTQYIVGTEVQLVGTFALANGALVDPTAVAAEIRTPDGVVTNLTSGIVHSDVGVYYVNFTPTQVGLHEYRFSGDGAVVAANESFFTAQTTF